MESRKIVIALFDVLGFENRLSSDGLRRFVIAYNELAAIVRESRDTFIIDGGANARQMDDGSILSNVRMGSLVVEQAYFSDTILLWAIFDQVRFWSFCDVCAEFICQVLHLGMPLRGGISVGEAHMNKETNTYLGYPLVEAARVEKAQQWIGVSFGPSFAHEPYRRIFRPESVIFFTAHRKTDAEGSQYIPGIVLDWPRKWRKMYQKSLCRHLAEMNTNKRYSIYYQTSIRFAEISEDREKNEG